MKRRTDHGDVPGADEMDVFRQVLPGQQTPEVSVKILPQNQSLLVTGLQTDRNINITSPSKPYNVFQVILCTKKREIKSSASCQDNNSLL